eukprot:CAMPEP_0194493452 /NCGR_PEP_ID=MMETSP0253-20130528/11661_1 /TAXON_ID=2966 /ORGANISM="Noctiluca scintillans" /LENGTH=48 /DNA_ID= /DNA_START= /DNA_END= /DNA_ORIENTATION=
MAASSAAGRARTCQDMAACTDGAMARNAVMSRLTSDTWCPSTRSEAME